jgi:hypothetical protein
MPYLLPTRSESVIFFEQKIDVTRTLKYISEKRKSNNKVKISLFYLVMYSALRVIAQRPKLNRFISGFRHYQRNRISFNFIAKRSITDDGEEVNVTMSFSPLLTLENFCIKLHEYIMSLKTGSSTGSEKTNSFLSSLPRFFD